MVFGFFLQPATMVKSNYKSSDLLVWLLLQITHTMWFVLCHDNDPSTMIKSFRLISYISLFSVSNKQVLVQYGVVDAVMSLSSSEVMAVVFKLLGVLRMLVDGQGIVTRKNRID